MTRTLAMLEAGAAALTLVMGCGGSSDCPSDQVCRILGPNVCIANPCAGQTLSCACASGVCVSASAFCAVVSPEAGTVTCRNNG
jgi:hypothetical protein